MIFAVAAFLRLYDLDLVPLHHDEGVNGNFLVRLVREGYYHYDPANYHGPTLYYFAAVFPWLLRLLFGPNAQNNYGLTTVAIRCVPALFGIATIALVFTLRRNLGTIATLSAAFLLAISPGAVYLSRYFIHETLFVFFTLGMVVAAVKYYEDPQPAYLMLGATSAALFVCDQRNGDHFRVVLVHCAGRDACLSPGLELDQLRPQSEQEETQRSRQALEVDVDDRDFLRKAGGPSRLAIWLVIAFVVFVDRERAFLLVVFYKLPAGCFRLR